jgi:hypothetical protein
MDGLAVKIEGHVNSTNDMYERLLRVDPENVTSLSYYSGFLKRFNNTIEISDTLNQKAMNLIEA